MTLAPVLTVTDAHDTTFDALVSNGLNAYNDAITGYGDRRPLNVVVSDPATGETIGGVCGRTSLGLMFIDIVYLPETMRGQDVGTRMLEMAEEEGRRRGCKSVVLYTISFQAPDFYSRLGYREFGRIACDPPGTSRVFMTKPLA